VAAREYLVCAALTPQQTSLGTNPQRAVRRKREGQYPIDVAARVIGPFVHREAVAVKARQPAERADPQVTVRPQNHGIHRVLREAVLGRPLIDGKLGGRTQRMGLLGKRRTANDARQRDCENRDVANQRPRRYGAPEGWGDFRSIIVAASRMQR
jgi:hypothetical protein